jgi:hypothetical protein
MTSIGAPLDRVDGPLKVCGLAHYSGDLALPRMAHAVLVTSTIASGRVAAIDAAAALRAPGVVAVISHLNALRLPEAGKGAVHPPDGRVLSLLQDDRVAYANQPIALVVAETFEQANGAAALVRVTYERAPAELDFEAGKANAYPPDKVNGASPDTARGDVEAGLAAAAHRVDAGLDHPVPASQPDGAACDAGPLGRRAAVHRGLDAVRRRRAQDAGGRPSASRPSSCTCARPSSAARSAARARRGRTWCWPRWRRARWGGRCAS